MAREIYVVGHKNPDTDSIVSAIAFADLLRRKGQGQVTPARQGEVWRETQYILDRMQVPTPLLLEDVRPTARDVMTTTPVVGRVTESAYAIGKRLRDKQVRAIPLVDDNDCLAGLITVEDFAHLLLTELEPSAMDMVHLDVGNVVETLGGRLLTSAKSRRLRDKVMVAAMDLESMRLRIEPDILMVMGDRTDAQRMAIEGGVGALVITGDLPISDEIVELARARDVTLISSPHHTFTTVRLLNLSIPVYHVMRRDHAYGRPEDSLDELRRKLAGQLTIPIIDHEERVVGVVSRSDLISPIRHGVYLVDHNERSQTVDGLDEADLLGIIDHHRIADIQSAAPVYFRNETVGSTSTIIAGLYREAGVAIPPPIAGILLGGVITDTVLFRSPTSTPRDEEVAHELAALSGLDPEEFGREIFSVVSDLSGRSLREIVTTDFKEFRIEEMPFAIGYLETVHRRRVDEIRDDLLTEMRVLRGEKGYAALLFMVVDIVQGQTEILIAGMEETVAEALGAPLTTPHSVTIEGVMSRKKQVVPVLPRIARLAKERA